MKRVALILLLIAACLLTSCSRRIDYVYMEVRPKFGYVYHLDPKCIKGTVMVDADEVFDRWGPSSFFCSNCVSDRMMERMEREIEIHKLIMLNPEGNEAQAPHE